MRRAEHSIGRERKGEESIPAGNKSGKVGEGTANEAIRGCYVGMHYVVMPIPVNWLAVDRFIEYTDCFLLWGLQMKHTCRQVRSD